MSQKPLFDPGPADGTLTERQRLVLEQLRQRPGMSCDEAGALLHAHAGKHHAETRCGFCARTGREVLHALRKKKLAKSSRESGWRALHDTERPILDGYDPATAPFPLGF